MKTGSSAQSQPVSAPECAVGEVPDAAADLLRELEGSSLPTLEEAAEQARSDMADVVSRAAARLTPALPSDVVGHKTFCNDAGERHHEPLTRAEANEWLAAADAAKAKRAADMPTEQDAINAMWSAHQRLQELGWNNAIYCPKDGSPFDAIEPGSTGIFRTHYSGKWPTGSWWAEDGGDLWPARPCLYRAKSRETSAPVCEQREHGNTAQDEPNT